MFQYQVTVALKDLQRTLKIKPFINKHNYKEINFPTKLKDWKKFESNNKSISFKVLFVEIDE